MKARPCTNIKRWQVARFIYNLALLILFITLLYVIFIMGTIPAWDWLLPIKIGIGSSLILMGIMYILDDR